MHPSSRQITSLYQTHGAAWAQNRTKALIERHWLDAFLGNMPTGPKTVLDIGCGTGDPIARYLIDNSCQITGLDGASNMTAAARATFPDHDWVTADMRQIPDIGPFNGLIAWHSFFHLPPDDQRRMFPTFRRLATLGAPLMFTSGTEAGEAIGMLEGEPLYHASLDTAEYQSLLAKHGFTVLHHLENDPACGSANIWLAQRL